MEDYVEEWLSSFADMKRRPGTDRDIKIERAHRLGAKKVGAKRSIIAKVLDWRDRRHIIRKAPHLKDRKYKGCSIYISYDVALETRMERKRLAEKLKELRGQGKYAHMPLTVPPVLITKDATGRFVRTHLKDL